jgi:hypothetical protein
LSAGRFACQKRAGLLLSKFTSLACGCFRGGQIFRQSLHDGVFKARQGLQQRLKDRRIEKDPTGHRTGGTFSILERQTIAGKGFGGIFMADRTKVTPDTDRSSHIEKKILFFFDFVFDRCATYRISCKYDNDKKINNKADG